MQSSDDNLKGKVEGKGRENPQQIQNHWNEPILHRTWNYEKIGLVIFCTNLIQIIRITD